MKANELRLGNYVNGIYDEGEFIAEVLTVDSEGCLLDANGIYELTSLKGIKPIPLTEEWLIKIDGIEKAPYDDDIKDYYLIKRCGFFDIIYEDNESIYIDLGDTLKKVKYLHQLQNLYFALTDEELTIKL